MNTLKSLSLVLFLLVPACGAKRTSEGVGNGSNTNWLRGCETDANCGNGVCASGACTETCDSDGDCRHLAANARCADAVPFVSNSRRSCDDVEPQRVCTRRCDDASDCRNIGDGYTCNEGSCEPASCVNVDRDSDAATSTSGEVATDPTNGEASTESTDPASGDCAALSPDECEPNGCVAISGQPVTAECEAWKPRPVGCAPVDSGDAAISCAVSPTDSLCYQFPTTTTPSGWETVSCEDDSCILPSCPSVDCFAPTQNLALAYAANASGCPCNGEGSACIEGVALMCLNDVWVAVADGPCSPMSEACDGWLASVEECITLFDSCAQVDGKHCGRRARTSLCEDGMLVDNQADCPEGIPECREVAGAKWCAAPLTALCDAHYRPLSDCSEMPMYACTKVTEAVSCGLRKIEPERCESEGAQVLTGEDRLQRGCARDFVATALLTTGGVCCAPTSLDGGSIDASGE